MLNKEINITKENFFLPRTAASLVQKAGKFSSRIVLEHGNKKANAKSLMGVLSLEARKGSVLVLQVEGADELAAMEGLEAFFDQNMQ